MACDRVVPLTVGWEYGPESISLEGGREDHVLRLPVNVVLVRSPAGWVLLESGLDPRPYRGAEEHDVYTVGLPEFPTEGDPLLDALGRHGVGLDDLAAVAVSHLHLAHSGGLRHVAGRVPVTIQARELAFATQRARRGDGYLREDYEVPGLAWRTIDGDAEIAPGVEAVFTPGHTPGHMSYRVRMAGTGTWLFAVDAIDLQEGIDTDTPIGWSAREQDAPLRRASHDRLVALAREEGARLVPGHCPSAWPALRSPPEGYR